MTGRINFFSEDVPFQLKQKRKIRHWLDKVINSSKFNYQELNFIFCSDEHLLKINNDFLHHDFYTDIITFSNSLDQSEIAGDFFISVDRVRENAKKRNIPFNDEIHRVMIHGVLHLMGYKDKIKSDKVLMRKMENRMLKIYDTI